MAEPQTTPAPVARRRLTHRQQQQQADKAMRQEYRARTLAKMDRVTAWVAQCAASREQHHHQLTDDGSSSGSSSVASFLAECDGETEDLLVQVLIARPNYEGIPSAEEIQHFAGQLRAYHGRLWTLGMTRGFFRAPDGATGSELLGWGNAADYPDDIDSLDSVSMRGDNDDEGPNWTVVQEKRVFVRKISPAEEELRDEMIQEYRNIRRHSSVNDLGIQKRFRTASVSATMKAAVNELGGSCCLETSGRRAEILY